MPAAGMAALVGRRRFNGTVQQFEGVPQLCRSRLPLQHDAERFPDLSLFTACVHHAFRQGFGLFLHEGPVEEEQALQRHVGGVSALGR